MRLNVLISSPLGGLGEGGAPGDRRLRGARAAGREGPDTNNTSMMTITTTIIIMMIIIIIMKEIIIIKQ